MSDKFEEEIAEIYKDLITSMEFGGNIVYRSHDTARVNIMNTYALKKLKELYAKGMERAAEIAEHKELDQRYWIKELENGWRTLKRAIAEAIRAEAKAFNRGV